MNYHKLMQAITMDYGVVEAPSLPESPVLEIRESFIAGRKIVAPLPNPLVFLVNHPPQTPPRHFVGGAIPVVTDLFVAALRGAGVDNFDAYPALLRNPGTGQEWTGRFAFNVLGLVDAASPRSSSVEIMPGGRDRGQVPELVHYTELVLDAARTRGLLMFRLATSPDVLLIHDRVLASLKAQSPSGGWGITVKAVEAV